VLVGVWVSVLNEVQIIIYKVIKVEPTQTTYLQIVFQDFGKVVLQLTASKVFKNLFPIRSILNHSKDTVPKRPRLGFSFPARIFSAVDLPIPFVPTSPRTWPGRGTGRRCSLNEFAEYLELQIRYLN
jgi:hypothetical protein